MTAPLEGKVALITGSGQGIGRALALGYAAAGAKVVVNDMGASLAGDRSGDAPADAVVSEIVAAGGQAVADFGDVSKPEDAEQMVARAVDAFGRLDIVVNNAGIVRDRIFHKMSAEEWDAVIKVHLYGSYNVSRAAGTVFRDQNGGSFIQITSTAGLIGNMGQANYSAAKAGIAALSRSIAIDMARYNVRSNAIAPFALTRMVTSIPTKDPVAFREKRKHMTADKMVPMAIYLSSDDAQDITGQVFAIKGNEVFLMSQPRPIRSIHRDGGWTHDDIKSVLHPSMKGDFTPLETTMDVFFWDTI